MLDLERVAVTLRPRTSWEATDLGYTMVRRWWRPIYAAWLAVTLPIALLLVGALGGWGWLLFRWLRPLWDRVPLHILSRAVFGATPGLDESLRAVPGLFRQDLVGSLVLRRLDPGRSFRMPIVQLEGLRGSERSRRARVLAGPGGEVGGWLTVAHQVMEVGLVVAGVAFLVMMTPDWVDMDWDLFFDRMAQGALGGPARFGLWMLPCLASMLLEPFYVGAGFALYLNRRVRLEGWDLEIAFRRLGRRVGTQGPGGATPGRRRAGVIAALMLTLAAALAAAPSAVAGEPVAARGPTAGTEWREWEGPQSRDPRLLADRILGQPEFARRVSRSHWRLRDFDLGQDQKEPARFELGRFLAAMLEPLLWIVVIVGAAVAVVLLLRRFGLLARAPWPSIEDQTPRTLFGLDITPESLPDHIPVAAEALWRAGRRAEAMSLLYRGALAHLARVDRVALRQSYTEDDCLRAARSRLGPRRRAYLASLTRVWQRTAYAHRPPDDAEATVLWSSWGEAFRRVRSR